MSKNTILFMAGILLVQAFCRAADAGPARPALNTTIDTHRRVILVDVRHAEGTDWLGCSVRFSGSGRVYDLPAQRVQGRDCQVVFPLATRGSGQVPEKYIVRLWGRRRQGSDGYYMDMPKASTDWQDVPVGLGPFDQRSVAPYRSSREGDLEFVQLLLLSPGPFARPADNVLGQGEHLDVVARVRAHRDSVYLIKPGINQYLYLVIRPDGQLADAATIFEIPRAQQDNYGLAHMNIWNINRDLLIPAGDREVTERIRLRRGVPPGDYTLIVGVRAQRHVTASRTLEWDKVFARKPLRVLP